MNSKQVMDSYGSGAHTRLRHHPLVLSQYRRGGSWVKGKRRYDLAVARKGKSILGLPLKLFWGKYPDKMTYHPKEARMNWNH